MKLSKGIQGYLANLITSFELKPHGPELVLPNPSTYCNGEKKYPVAEDRVGSICASKTVPVEGFCIKGFIY